MRRHLCMLPALLVAAACASTTEPAARASVVEVQYVNFAWVATYRGFVIDSTGLISSYDLAGKQWTPSDAEHPTQAELDTKYAAGRKPVRTLSASERSSIFDLAARAPAGAVTKPVMRCADAGVLSYTVYSQGTAGTTTRVLVRSEGDVIALNTSAAAKDLAAKLAGLGLIPPIPGCQP